MLNAISIWILPLILLLILTTGMFKKVPVYETFVEGAKDGISVSLKIIPYLVAIIVATSMFRASGAIELLSMVMAPLLTKFNIPVDVLPLAIVRSLSGSASLGVLADIAQSNPVESYTTKLAAIMLGSSETTFYVLSVYFGAVGIKKFRYALLTGIIADVIGIIAAIAVANVFFM